MDPKYVLFYESAEHAMPKAREHFAAHEVHYPRFVAEGTVIGVGTSVTRKTKA